MQTDIKFPELPLELTGNDVFWTIQQANALKVEWPDRPKRPVANPKSSAEHKKYAAELEAYEAAMKTYDAEWAAMEAHNHLVDHLIIEYVKKTSGLTNVPEKSRDKVWRKAWEEGHSSGYLEVYYKLLDLVDLFE